MSGWPRSCREPPNSKGGTLFAGEHGTQLARHASPGLLGHDELIQIGPPRALEAPCPVRARPAQVMERQ